jgi:hypothetical protein
MRSLLQLRTRLGFPIWLPLFLGVALFWVGHLFAGERHHPRPHVVNPVHLIAV